MATSIKKLVPKYIARPGEILSEEIQSHGFTPEYLLNTFGLPIQTLDALIQNRISISPEIALILGKAFDQSPEFWLNLQIRYNALTKNKLQVEKSV